MGNFKIGEKVVCVNPNKRLKKGEIYTIESFDECACGDISLILLGVDGGGYFASDCRCGRMCSNRCHSTWRFRKLDYEFAENLLAEISEAMKSETIKN